jgi:Ca2+-binding EF-hand superfamily protein
MLRALNQVIAEVLRHQDTQPGTSGRATTSSTQQKVDDDTFREFISAQQKIDHTFRKIIPNVGGLDAPIHFPKDALPPTEQQAAPSAATEVPLLPEWFREIDIEKKGEIGREEFITYSLKRFDTLDTKHEGKLTLKEFLKFFGPPKSYVLNTNSDGLVDRIEAESAAGAEFDQYDLDRNGRINEAEVRLVMLRALNQVIAEVLRHQDTQPGTSGRATTSSNQQKVDHDSFRKFIPHVGGLIGLIWLIGWLIRKIKGNTSPQQGSHRVEGSPESVASDPQRAAPPISATGQDIQESVSWRERLARLPTDGSITINGLVVWKLQAKDGRIYYSGEREFSSVEDVLSHYKPPVPEAIVRP